MQATGYSTPFEVKEAEMRRLIREQERAKQRM
jgi:hypothetical protein